MVDVTVSKEERSQNQSGSPYRILSLDGGGAKGFYTLGVLREIEAMIVNRPGFRRHLHALN
jgi:patatin-like phospholipase/acyl hydrolase